jgi:hypothetical protein
MHADSAACFLFKIGDLERRQPQMDYGMIGKIQKAKRYAEQRDRIHFESLSVTFNGDNNPHTVHMSNGAWQCDCDFFTTRGRCSHTIALEIILEGMIPEPVV